MKNLDEILVTVFAIAQHEYLQSQPDWLTAFASPLDLTLSVFERLGLVEPVPSENGEFKWRHTNEFIRLARKNGFRVP